VRYLPWSTRVSTGPARTAVPLLPGVSPGVPASFIYMSESGQRHRAAPRILRPAHCAHPKRTTNGENDMDAKETVMALYQAYGSGEAARIGALLHEDVTWIAPPGNATQVAFGLGRAEDAGAPYGANTLRHADIVRFMAYNFARFFGAPRNEFRAIAAQGERVYVEHRLAATLPNGRAYVNDYCFAFEVSEGKVRAIREYMDTRGGWAQVFGGEEGRPLLPFAQGPAT
jgi:ketosteroid isomerase-like protein